MALEYEKGAVADGEPKSGSEDDEPGEQYKFTGGTKGHHLEQEDGSAGRTSANVSKLGKSKGKRVTN